MTAFNHFMDWLFIAFMGISLFAPFILIWWIWWVVLKRRNKKASKIAALIAVPIIAYAIIGLPLDAQNGVMFGPWIMIAITIDTIAYFLINFISKKQKNEG